MATIRHPAPREEDDEKLGFDNELSMNDAIANKKPKNNFNIIFKWLLYNAPETGIEKEMLIG